MRVFTVLRIHRVRNLPKEVKQQHFSICLSGRETFYFVNANPKYQQLKFIFLSYKNWTLSYYERYELFASEVAHFLPILQNVFDGSFLNNRGKNHFFRFLVFSKTRYFYKVKIFFSKKVPLEGFFLANYQNFQFLGPG